MSSASLRTGPPSLSLRFAREEDAPDVWRMLRALAEEIGEGAEFASRLEDVRRDAFGPKRRYDTLIAIAGSDPAGLATFFETYSTYKGRPCLYVNDIYVEPMARRWRLGRFLMAEIARLALARDCCRVELKVLAGNPARRFYQSIGMSESAELAYAIRDEALDRLARGDSL
jgi:GNAT superfamily N-acetyltransferase